MTSSVNGFLPLVRENWEKKTRNQIYKSDPVAWAIEVAGIKPWRAQREMAYLVRDNRAVAVAAGHSVGKTYWTAALCCWWIDVHPVDDVFIASTAPSADQVSLLWDNIRQMFSQIKRRFDEGIIDHALPGYITGDNAWKLPDGRLIGQGRKPPDNKSDVAFQGRHAPYLLAIADEAVGVPGGFLDALGNIATGRNNRQLLIANPTDPSSAMAKIWRDKNEEWVTMHISVLEAPTFEPEEGFDADEMAARGMAGEEYVQQKLAEYGGEEDPRYIARVLGQWAFDSGNNVFSQEDISRGVNCEVVPDPDAVPEMGVDIARMGKDSSVVYTILEGQVWETVENDDGTLERRATGRKGFYLRRLDEWRKAPVSGNDPNNLGSAQRVHQHALATGAKYVKLDASGIGGGVIDGIEEIAYKNNGVPYLWFEIFAGSTTGVDTRQYINARASQYFRFKKLLFDGVLDIDFNDKELIEELEEMVFEFDARGRIKIEAKDDMKRRGVKSPDHADAAWYALMDVDAMVNGIAPGSKVLLDDYPIQNEYEYSGGYGMPV